MLRARTVDKYSAFVRGLISKNPLSLKKTNPVEVKEAMLKTRRSKQRAMITFHQKQSRNQLKYFATLSVYFLIISWKIPGYLNNGTR